MNAGVVVAGVLAGSWREHPPPLELSVDELAAVERALMASGAGGLVWHRLPSEVRATPAGERFHEAYRLHAIYARAHEEQIVRVVSTLLDNGIEPLVVKGWDSARLYPHAGMRPYGDLDLCVRPTSVEQAEATLAGTRDETDVDLVHAEIEPAWVEGMFARAESVALGACEIRVLSDEDRLRTLALHALKGGVWRPLSLCDVAAALESRSEHFDWDVCLPDPPTRDRGLAALALAGRLLGADLRGTPAEGRLPPRWLIREALANWAAPWPATHGVAPRPLGSHLTPAAIVRGLVVRWPGPTDATLRTGARFGSAPRLPIQLLDVVQRTVRFVGAGARR